MAEGELEAFDTTILLSLRSAGDPQDPIGPHRLEAAVRDVTALGGNVITIFVTLASVGYLGRRRTHWAATFVLLAVASGMLLGSDLTAGLDRPRPDLGRHGERRVGKE